ncbi:MAG: c-type cytochrome biogenesis protein CcmI [Acetobacter fabarum]|jgi:cytochrome c-type biogenesis protein CcmH|nr:c-type cytochrome biogenesis protein CcmI [Acetobacter fabarum]MCI1908483.1 c-type cytochrome biogenesis protein CcmI [Acetobacter fabarum]MCI1926806.1 c-type cytochrome biogenesis protein CcmI [Acetobacter fabarum]MCI1946805.1 c-type cytochrome biogenesis protein CcmI [Acetobacter fabarum]MCI1987973.1 c-type cytochrome biogenesis protein CcmI [Acetobacter fabarum]
MIWLSIGLLSLLALAPAIVTLWKRTRVIRDERSTALALHEAQLAELDRDLAIGLIAPTEHDVAILEIQRRILSADAAPSTARANSSAMLGWFGLAAVPALAIALYLTNGTPYLPAQPLGPRLVAQHMQNRKADALIAQLQQAMASLPADDPNRRQGYLLLGQLQASGDHYAQAAEAWNHALALGFDPELAARTAEAMTRAEHHVTTQALALFRKALDAAPQDAPWRPAVQGRIAQGEHDQENP